MIELIGNILLLCLLAVASVFITTAMVWLTVMMVRDIRSGK